ncbi:hypothetical protein V493_05587 [Pseudogymnoascus sp. VKM F-4281 (FW-2241)]|nr:hypothetical protein V493_05587 [Pseudogymnoascus sp. VKM F-4281 (FW-2241)]
MDADNSSKATGGPTQVHIANMEEKVENDVAHKELKPEYGAQNAEAQEKSMTLLQAIKLYPTAIGWSMVLSTALVMEGYDLLLLSNLYASPMFNQKYGILGSTGEYAVPASWQSGLSNGARCGEMLGLAINGIVSEKYGYRKTMIGSLFMMIGTIFILFFAPNVQVLLVGEIFCGIPWGVFQTLTTAYASEVSPVVLRPYLTTYVNLCWVMGQFIASGVLRASLQRPDEWAYKIPFAIQWVWPVPLLVGCFLAPESPWWEVRRGNREGAKRALERLTSANNPHYTVEETLEMIEHTNELEKSLSEGTSYWDCFKGIDRRRTEIVCGVWLVQTLCGTNVMGYSTYFLKQAGLPTVQSFNMSLGQQALGVVGTLLSWFLISRAGRRTIYLSGVAILCVILMIVGFISLAPSSNTSAAWAIGVMLLVFTFVYDFTVGPVCYSLVSEISSTRLKTKTIVLARIGYNISNTVINVLTNYQLNPTAWAWGAKTAFFWGCTCLCCVVWVFFRLPEPKGRTYAEIDVLFESGVSPRKFKTTEVDTFQAGHTSAPEKTLSTA